MRKTRLSAAALGAVACGAVAFTVAAGDLFEKPVRLQAGGEYIDTDIGHSAPYLYDYDGDGVRDLLVGQFGGGKLRIYRNAGTNEKPTYETHTWFEGTVPAG